MFYRGLLLSIPVLALALSNVRADDENPVVTLAKSKVKDKTKPFGMTVTFKVKAGEEKAFEEAFKPCGRFVPCGRPACRRRRAVAHQSDRSAADLHHVSGNLYSGSRA